MTDLSCSFPGCECHPSKGDDILRISAKGRGEPFVGRCREHYGAEIPADLAQSMAYAKRPDVQQSLAPAPQGRVFRIGVNPQSGELSVTQTAGEPLGLSFTADDRPVVPESVTAVECVSPAPTVDREKELRERMNLIERFAKALAHPHCQDCEGDGIDEEGAEWTLCECVRSYLRTSERVSPAPTEGDGNG